MASGDQLSAISSQLFRVIASEAKQSRATNAASGWLMADG
jgi:hypothetical protein